MSDSVVRDMAGASRGGERRLQHQDDERDADRVVSIGWTDDTGKTRKAVFAAEDPDAVDFGCKRPPPQRDVQRTALVHVTNAARSPASRLVAQCRHHASTPTHPTHSARR